MAGRKSGMGREVVGVSPTNSVQTREELDVIIRGLEERAVTFRAMFNGEVDPVDALTVGGEVESLAMRAAWALGNPFRRSGGRRPAEVAATEAVAG